MVRPSRLVLLAVLLAWMFACDAASDSAMLVGDSVAEGDCPVTEVSKPGFIAPIPTAAVYTDNFPTLASYPTEYPEPDAVWYGGGALWTVLSLDGEHDERKTVFWSTDFPGGTVEEKPELDVVWTLLNGAETIVVENDRSTNAYTPDHGWFMITGPEEQLPAGCWQVEAAYKGATLSYVYEKS